MDKKYKLTVPVQGMHCRSCEILIEDKLGEIPEVEKSVINHRKGTAEIYYGSQKPNMREVENAIREAGYNIGENSQRPLISRNASDYKDLGIAFLFLMGIFVVLKSLGITNIGVTSGDPASLGIVLLVGLTAGVSTCMALVGGLILGISARHAEKHPEATPMQKFRPHLFFNAGRILSYALLGGLLGTLGSFLQLSGFALGMLTIVVGAVMLLLGLKLTGLFPRLENATITLPKGVAKMLGIKKHDKEYDHRGSFLLGALTFFLPCGFTQAMQLYAISTGSFAQGFLVMGLFALGTAPGLLGVGGLTSVVKGIFARRFFKFAGLVVIFMALFNVANGFNLTGWQIATDSKQQAQGSIQKDPNVTVENGVQVVRMTENSRGYSPNKFTIKKGMKVKWIIDAKDPYSCASSLMVSKLGIRKNLKQGENVIEFTPTESGRLPFSCSMGMYTGVFNVVEEDGSSDSVGGDEEPSAPVSSGTCGAQASNVGGGSAGGCGASGGGCGGCGGTASSVSTEDQAVGTVENGSQGEQIIRTVYAQDTDISPAVFTVAANKPVRFEIDVKDDGFGCMSTIMIPGLYNTPELLEAGGKIVMEFTPSQKGTYNITCSMGMVRGALEVE